MFDLQWVWWGWLDWAFYYERLDPKTRSMGHIYLWLLRVGPVEVRKWTPKMKKAADAEGGR